MLQMFFSPDIFFPRCPMRWLSVVGPRKRDREVGCGGGQGWRRRALSPLAPCFILPLLSSAWGLLRPRWVPDTTAGGCRAVPCLASLGAGSAATSPAHPHEPID